MAIAPVQRKTNVSGAAVASLSAVFDTPPTSGRLLTAAVASDATVSMTSSGWTLATSAVNFLGLYLWYKVAGGSESSTVTVTPGVSAAVAIAVAEFSGNTATPLDQVASNAVAASPNNASTATASTGTTAATAQADEYAIAVFATFNGGETYDSYSNSFAETAEIIGAGGSPVRLAVAEVVLTSTGTVETTATLSTAVSTGKHALIATFKAGSFSPPVNTVAPVVSGTAQQGQTLSATQGTWSPAGDSYTYQWQRKA